ncbi:MAG: hypothetical protein AVDCRST_MAG73-12, partial [uncultured Thermomicrobiales bacterium]
VRTPPRRRAAGRMRDGDADGQRHGGGQPRGRGETGHGGPRFPRPDQQGDRRVHVPLRRLLRPPVGEHGRRRRRPRDRAGRDHPHQRLGGSQRGRDRRPLRRADRSGRPAQAQGDHRGRTVGRPGDGDRVRPGRLRLGPDRGRRRWRRTGRRDPRRPDHQHRNGPDRGCRPGTAGIGPDLPPAGGRADRVGGV